MRYASINFNDITAAPGLCVTVFLQGCPHHCPGCHNPTTWDFNGGEEFTAETMTEIIEGLNAQNIQRNLCIMGGEPLAPQNTFLTNMIINEVKLRYPDIKIYVWTGYTYEEIQLLCDSHVKHILEQADYLIDGRYIEELRDITLEMRGSSNQRIIDLKEKLC
jgi:anaerobic ribonucleoside-triphosphate reductase activating protein